MRVSHIDHLVLTVSDIDRTMAFYQQILGFEPISFGEGRKALKFGHQKFNLHQAGREFEPKADRPTPGSADLCLIVKDTMDQVIEHLRQAGVRVESGPVARTGATGPLESVYIRDPDGNLIELSRPSDKDPT